MFETFSCDESSYDTIEFERNKKLFAKFQFPMRSQWGHLKRLYSSLSRDQIAARQKTLDLIERPLGFGEPAVQSQMRDPSFYLHNHPNAETALRIRQQMDEISLLIEKMDSREQAANRVIVLAASAFLVTSVAYTVFQLSDVNTAFSASLPSLFTLMEYSTARKVLCRLSGLGLLPVDFGSEDPYLIRVMNLSEKHPKTRSMRLCVPVGLGAGIDIDCEGPEGFLKIGFGSIEIGPVSINPDEEASVNNVQLMGSSIVSDILRRDGSQGFHTVSNRLCEYIQRRPNDLLTRNTVTGISFNIKAEPDVDVILRDQRLMAVADYISLDVSALDEDEILRVVKRLDKEAETLDSLPLIFLKVDLKQSLPPSRRIASAIVASHTIVGVNVNGVGLAGGNDKITKFVSDSEVRIAGQMVKGKSTEAVGNWFRALGDGKQMKEIIASGGVFSGQDALEKIEAGASLVNVFSAFVLEGPPIARRIKTQLSVRLMNKGYYNLDEIIGSNHRILSKRLRDARKRRKRF